MADQEIDWQRFQSGDVVYIARCPEHGLHGERDACFVCEGPVEKVPMVAVENLQTAPAIDWAILEAEAAVDAVADLGERVGRVEAQHLTHAQRVALTTRADLVASEAIIVSKRQLTWRGRLAEIVDMGTSGGSAADRRQIIEAMAALEDA